MQIQIIATSVETKATAKGSYQILEATYKNLTYQGKTESKKIMSFGANGPAFKALADAQPGSTWEVTVVKNAQGYNDWTSVQPATGTAAPAAPNKVTNNSAPAARSSYETPEERAQRQVLIVKQSSLGHALTLLCTGAKSAPKLEEVLDTAQKITDFVFGVQKTDPGASGFEDMPNFDIPDVQ